MPPRQAEHALNEANGADAARGERGVGPLLERGADALTLADEAIDKGLLPRRGLGLAGARRKHAGRDPRVHRDERVGVEDADEVRVPAHADPLPEERERHGIEGAGDFDVAIGVDGALAAGEERERPRWRAAAARAARPRRSASRPGAASCRECAAARWCDSSAAETHCGRRDCRSVAPSAHCSLT